MDAADEQSNNLPDEMSEAQRSQQADQVAADLKKAREGSATARKKHTAWYLQHYGAVPEFLYKNQNNRRPKSNIITLYTWKQNQIN